MSGREAATRVGVGDLSYAWQERWADVPHAAAEESGWAHHGVAVTSTGDVVTFHPGGSDVLVLGRDGSLRATWTSGLLEGHGITVVADEGVDHLWIADPGVKARRNEDGTFSNEFAGSAVVKFSLDGERLMELSPPPIAAYESGDYRPTWVAVDERHLGGSGDIWVADGYGFSLVHHYNAAGEYLATIDGTEGAGRFSCPHGLLMDRRHGSPELYIADRGSARVQVYGLDGEFRRVVGEGVLNSPSAFAVHGSHLVIGELFARLAILDLNDNLVCFVGEDDEARSRPGWPNRIDVDGTVVRPILVEAHFNSPHGLAVDGSGNLLVAEWLIGGRLTRLLR